MKLVPALVGLAIAFAISFGLSYVMAREGAEPGSSPYVLGAVIGTTIALAMSNMSGNRKVKLADAGARKAAMAMEPSADKALLVVYREGFMGKAVGVDVTLDGKDLAQLKSPRFTAQEIAPGQHRLTATLTGQMNAASKPGDVTFDVAAGQTAIFRLGLAMKLATSDIVLAPVTDQALARKRIAGMAMVVPSA